MNKPTEIFSHMDCYLMAMQLICTAMKKDFSYMFVKSWRFQYDSLQKELVVTNSYDAYAKILDFSYLGITGRKISRQDTNLHALKKYIDTYKVLLVSTDSFYCPWHRGYSNANVWHCCALVDYSEEGLWCVDPYLKGDNRFLLPLCTLDNGEIYYYIESDPTEELDIKTVFKKIVSDAEAIKNRIAMIEAYKKDICSIEKSEDLFDFPTDIYLCKITRGLKSIFDGRYQLGYLLEHLYEKQGCEDKDVRQICQLLYNVSDLWQNVHNVIIRLYYDSGRLEKTKMKFETYLTRIIEMEKMILSKIKSYLSENV